MINQEEQELETVENQYWVDQYEDLKFLLANKQFQNVILNGYIEKKALEGVSLLAVPAIKKSGDRPEVMEDLVAISNLQYHFKMIENFGSTAEDDLLDAEGPDTEE